MVRLYCRTEEGYSRYMQLASFLCQCGYERVSISDEHDLWAFKSVPMLGIVPVKRYYKVVFLPIFVSLCLDYVDDVTVCDAIYYRDAADMDLIQALVKALAENVEAVEEEVEEKFEEKVGNEIEEEIVDKE